MVCVRARARVCVCVGARARACVFKTHTHQANGLELLIRSHECKDEGYEVEHGGKTITGVFPLD